MTPTAIPFPDAARPVRALSLCELLDVLDGAEAQLAPHGCAAGD